MCGGRSKGPSAEELAAIEQQKFQNEQIIQKQALEAQAKMAREAAARTEAAAKKAMQEAEAKIKQMEKERENEKAKENAAMVAGQVEQANADAKRRATNRTLLSGVEEEEGGDSALGPIEDGEDATPIEDLEDEEWVRKNSGSQSRAKRKRATLISSFGE